MLRKSEERRRRRCTVCGRKGELLQKGFCEALQEESIVYFVEVDDCEIPDASTESMDPKTRFGEVCAHFIEFSI